MSQRNYLFNKRALSDVMRAHEARLFDAIDAIDGDEFLGTSPDDLTSYFTDEYRLEVPILDESEITVDQSEEQVDVSQDHRRAIFDTSQPFYLTGTRVTFYVPFSGDPGLFDFRALLTWMWVAGRSQHGETAGRGSDRAFLRGCA